MRDLISNWNNVSCAFHATTICVFLTIRDGFQVSHFVSKGVYFLRNSQAHDKRINSQSLPFHLFIVRRTNNVDHLCQVLERSKREERRLSASTMCSARVYLCIVYKNTLFAKVAQNVDEESERAYCVREKSKCRAGCMHACVFCSRL